MKIQYNEYKKNTAEGIYSNRNKKIYCTGSIQKLKRNNTLFALFIRDNIKKRKKAAKNHTQLLTDLNITPIFLKWIKLDKNGT